MDPVDPAAPDAGTSSPDAGTSEDPGPMSSSSVDAGAVETVDAGSAGDSDLGIPASSDTGAGLAPEEDAGKPTAAPDVTAPQAVKMTLDPAIKASLSIKVGRSKSLEARRLNRRGLKKHKRRDYTGAISSYEDAMSVNPRAVFPRYNAACAYALVGRRDAALQQLLAIVELRKHDKIMDARIDSDFTSLYKDPAFREITGDASVRVLPRNRVRRQVVTDFIKVIRKASHFRAKQLQTPSGLGVRSTVFVRPGFEAQAKVIAELVDGASVQPAPAALAQLDGDVFVLVAAEADVAGASGRELERFTDVKLRGKKGRIIHQLKLKSTGFFVWTMYVDDGAAQTQRNGTYKVDGTRLNLSYRETRELENGEVIGPDDKESKLSFSVSGTVLTLNRIRFRR